MRFTKGDKVQLNTTGEDQNRKSIEWKNAVGFVQASWFEYGEEFCDIQWVSTFGLGMIGRSSNNVPGKQLDLA